LSYQNPKDYVKNYSTQIRDVLEDPCFEEDKKAKEFKEKTLHYLDKELPKLIK